MIMWKTICGVKCKIENELVIGFTNEEEYLMYRHLYKWDKKRNCYTTIHPCTDRQFRYYWNKIGDGVIIS